ncbi:MAG: AMP-binding protein [Pseudomonadota bacterium]
MAGREGWQFLAHDGLIGAERFQADVAAMRPRIAGASAVCNMLADRYDYMVALAAAMLNGQRSILPSSTAPGAVAAALEGEANPLILGPETAALSVGAAPDPLGSRQDLAAATGEIHVFTSGSTGYPVRHRKNWSILAGGAEVTEVILRRIAPAGRFALLGTTPHQHMYGLEATVFAGLAYGHCVYRDTIFYPADLEQAARSAQMAGIEHLILVTSPAHLRFLESEVLATRSIAGVISATAPLAVDQARRLEDRGGPPVYEIYGSTETGSLAVRRTVEETLWTPAAGFTLDPRPEGCIAAAPHLPEAMRLADAVSVEADGRFRLLGRLGDMVNIAGKRSSLGMLNAVVQETPGLRDAVVLRRRGEGSDSLCILAVIDPAAGLGEEQAMAAIRRQLRQHVDPVFVPNRIWFADHLPRTAVGKILAGDLEGLIPSADAEVVVTEENGTA